MTNTHEIQGRQADRDKLACDVAEFERRGGKIEVIRPGTASDTVRYFGKVMSVVPAGLDEEDDA